jgi:hypothetical protein
VLSPRRATRNAPNCQRVIRSTPRSMLRPVRSAGPSRWQAANRTSGVRISSIRRTKRRILRFFHSGQPRESTARRTNSEAVIPPGGGSARRHRAPGHDGPAHQPDGLTRSPAAGSTPAGAAEWAGCALRFASQADLSPSPCNAWNAALGSQEVEDDANGIRSKPSTRTSCRHLAVWR